MLLGGMGNDLISSISGQDKVLTGRGDDQVVIDGQPGIGSYGQDKGGPVFNKTHYVWHENTQGNMYLQLDVTDPDHDPISRVEVVGADGSVFSSGMGNGATLGWMNQLNDYERPVDQGQNNTYEVTVRAYTADGRYSDSAITIDVLDDGRPANQEWPQTVALYSPSSIQYVVGQSGQIPLQYSGLNMWNATLSGADAGLFSINGESISFKTLPTSAASVRDANRDGTFEFSLQATDYSGKRSHRISPSNWSTTKRQWRAWWSMVGSAQTSCLFNMTD